MLDKQQVRDFLAALQPKLAEIGKELGWSLTVSSARYGDVLNFKVEAVPTKQDGTSENLTVLDFKRYASSFGLTPADFGRQFTSRGIRFEICGMNRRAYKMPILAKNLSNGKVFKFHAEDVKRMLGASVSVSKKRSDEAIIDELREVLADLSPENLTCDGELNIEVVRKRAAGLNARKAELLRELGRAVTDEELFGNEEMAEDDD